MFYKEIINILKSNQAIADSVGEYKNSPAIFSEHAPEEATEEGGSAYIVIRIETSPLTDRVISDSNLFIDYFDYKKSRSVCNQYALDLVDLLDFVRLRTEQVNDLRILLTKENLKKSNKFIPGHNEDFYNKKFW